VPAAPGSAKTRLRLKHLRFFFRVGKHFFGSVPKRDDRSPGTTFSGLANAGKAQDPLLRSRVP